MANRSLSERQVVFLVGAVQFVNILDFMMVMPLGPDFARAFDMPLSHLGWIGGGYTASAAVAGFAGSYFLDRFDRRSALLVAMAGLAVGTALGGLAWDLPTLLLARVVAGAFGGPATSVSFSIIADVIPVERRGRAMGAVMGAFAAASIAGVPAGLELARIGTWQWPFFGTALIGFIITVLTAVMLPSMRGHLAERAPRQHLRVFLRPVVVTSFVMTTLAMAGGFIIIPNISGYLQANLGFPRGHIWMLYTAGGVVSFFSSRIAGQIVDRVGGLQACIAGVLLLSLTIGIGFMTTPPLAPVWAVFMLFMLAMAFRNVAYNTQTTKVPRPAERAQFMSLQSTVQHLASAVGAMLSARILTEQDGKLQNMNIVAAIAIGLNLALPVAMASVQRALARQQAAARSEV